MDHTGSSGSTAGQRAKQAGYGSEAIAENVAAGSQSVEGVMDAWMRSDGHRKNLLNDDILHFGFGYAYTEQDGYHHFWTQDFGGAKNETCDDGNNKPTPTPTIQPTSPSPKPQPTTPVPSSSPLLPTPAPSTTAPTIPSPTLAPPTPAPTPTRSKKCHVKKA